jgi:hypothetical protein
VISAIEAKTLFIISRGAKESNGAESSATTARTIYTLSILAQRYFGCAK